MMASVWQPLSDAEREKQTLRRERIWLQVNAHSLCRARPMTERH
jgi:hypothetical protein